MGRLSPQEHAAKWAAKFGSSGEAYKQGIARTQGSPAQKAIAAQDRMVANYNESVSSGRWAARMSAVSEAGWKQAATEKGAPAIANAARVAMEKVARAEATMGPIRQSIVDSLPPRGSIEENLERGRLMALRMHEARKRA